MFVTYLDAIKILNSGNVVAIPTETVYGLAANANSDDSIMKIYETKQRPTFNPLIVHIADPMDVYKYAIMNSNAEKIISHFWNINNTDKPITIVLSLNKSSYISRVGLGGLETIAIRFPTHPLANKILKSLDFPLMMPSANLSQTISPTDAVGVLRTLDVPVVDGGKCSVGIESTILDLSDEVPVLLRKGAVLKEECEKILCLEVLDNNNFSTIKAPGMMKRHYAPTLSLRLDAEFPNENEAWIAFGKSEFETAFQLSESGNLQEAASNLFKMLMEADDPAKYSSIAVMPIPKIGIGAAILDRLERGASKSK